jgi:hypothetical protein
VSTKATDLGTRGKTASSLAEKHGLKHIKGWSKIRGEGSHRNQNGMLSTADGGKTNVIGKMNNAKNAMRQKQGGSS